MNEYMNQITLTQERYQELLDAEDFLNRLYAAGVDNWEGYEIAQEDQS